MSLSVKRHNAKNKYICIKFDNIKLKEYIYFCIVKLFHDKHVYYFIYIYI